MKKITSILAVAVMAMLVMVATPSQAQNRGQKKDAKKEARRLKKEGFQTMALPIERQLADFYAKYSEKNEDGMPKYLMSDATTVGNSYSAAQMEAVNVAKVRLAGQIQSTVMSEAKIQLANSQLSAEDAASVGKALEKSTVRVAQKISRVIIAQEMYRILPNKNYEIRVVMLYDAKSVHDMMIEEVRESLKKDLDDFTPLHEQMVKDIIDKGVCGK